MSSMANSFHFREIVDESDVYVDVHKAIRRMAPAPKARHQRRSSHGARSVADEEGKSSEDTKVGEDEDDDHRMRRHASYTETSETQKRSGSPMTSFLMRRSSSGIDGRTENVPVRASFDDIKQHLKHLGPSNRASNPKATRSTTVKIKPGIPHELPRSSLAVEEVIPEEGDERTSLLKGMLTPKDGAHALATSYGAMALSRSPEVSNPSIQKIDTTEVEDQATQTSAHPSNTDLRAIAEAAGRVDPELRSKKSGSGKSTSGKSASGSEGDFVEGPGPYSHRKSLFARSGSITEQVVETPRGIKKTVLETTSSNDEDDETSRTPKLVTRSTPSLPFLGEVVLSPIESPENEEDQDSTPLLGGHEAATSAGDNGGDAGEGAASNQNGGGENGNGAGKKKNRRKKRKGKS